MKKFTFLLSSMLAFATTFSFAQNLVTNPGFDGATGANDGVSLMRVANHQDATTQTANPAVAATPVTDGLWVIKAPNSGYIKATVHTNLTDPDGSEESNSCLALTHGQNNGASGLESWWQCVAQQRLATDLDITKKYIISFDAKVNDETNPTLANVCDQVVAVIRDIAKNIQTTQTISLSGGTTWTEYTATFNLPVWVEGAGAGADGQNLIVGLGIKAEYGLNGDDTKTKFSSVLIDNVSLQAERISTGILNPTDDAFQCFVQNNTVKLSGVSAGETVAIYNVAGIKVTEQVVAGKDFSIELNKGVYVVRVANNTKKILVK